MHQEGIINFVIQITGFVQYYRPMSCATLKLKCLDILLQIYDQVFPEISNEQRAFK